MYQFISAFIFTFITLSSQSYFAAEIETDSDTDIDINRCIGIKDKDLRLSCYDDFHEFEIHKKSKLADVKETLETHEQKEESLPIEKIESSLFDGTVSYEKVKRSGFSILPHLPTFMIPLSYDESRAAPADLTGEEEIPNLDNLEVKYQISFKLNLWDNLLGEDTSLMGAYTQRSFWQMYNSDISSPFRETNYEPELFLSKESDVNFLGIKLIDSIVGFSHQSNGRSGLKSRSWNRAYTNFLFQQNDFLLSLKLWKRIDEELEDDDNPDIDDYLGHYEIGMLYQWKENEVTLLLRNLGSNKHQETYQLAWLVPLNDDINFYVEFFHGYGESLIDYNVMRKSLGIGITINDWVE